ncbi:MAG: FHA domain-containing protein FhaB [Pelotomaculum sp. PtaB.Bin013]|uniref:FHA domain-containing protein n=1 Tax=Pelotomaculum isophthalicicum JI TaxID=947010 RepID=A0A9X4JTY2_9FIRM|nr:FHA domain-containing protein [Pelotomaculum isophthalicicum]MDF9408155.1 FHA domain-containing protein [Pelotomaculum isophthalicicum JI]OPX80911.1 MAG: FHA domain-containing protein FhaB [Pelotomaculum sp. PtaB.Bin013]
MLNILIMTLRYAFLLLLILSIFRLVKWMITDLKEVSSQQIKDSLPSRQREEPRSFERTGQVELVVVESSVSELKPGGTFGFDRETLIGRDNRSDIVISASFASARHARIYFKEGQYWLEDLHSTNGTFLNEIQVNKPIVLANGDKIRIGGVIFQFVRWGYEVGADH